MIVKKIMIGISISLGTLIIDLYAYLPINNPNGNIIIVAKSKPNIKV